MTLRIAVCLPQVPFEHGGAEILAQGLVDALAERGHRSSLVTVPFRWSPNVDLLQNALIWRLLDLTESNGAPIDLVIGTKFPSYLVRHPRKVIWLFHQFRQAYDLHGTHLAQFADDPEGSAMREAVRKMDARAFGECRAAFAISENVAARLRKYNGLEAGVLRPPAQRLDLAWRGDDGYVLSVGRLDLAKRNDLLLEALALMPDASAVIVGDGPDQARLRGLARSLGLNGRVRFAGRVAEEELADLYGRCRAVFYAPHDEDHGFVPTEAHLAEKPVVTTTDAGGPLEVVRDGETGLVVEPNAESIAAGLRRLLEDARLSRRLGAAGAPEARMLNWDHVVTTLVESAVA